MDFTCIVEELQKYAELEYSEAGEASMALVELWRYRDFLSKEFIDAYQLEVISTAGWFKSNCEIVTREEIVTKTVLELEWHE